MKIKIHHILVVNRSLLFLVFIISFNSINGQDISGVVWDDNNGNGIRDDGPSNYLSGINVELLDNTGAPLTPSVVTVSDGNGNYSLTPPGNATYILSFDGFTPNTSGFSVFTTKFGFDSKLLYPNGSMPFLTNDITYVGNPIGNIDAGVFTDSEVKGEVFEDIHVDGIQDVTDPLLTDNGSICLHFPNGSSAIDALGSAIPCISTSNGNYTFNNVPPGSYYVQVNGYLNTCNSSLFKITTKDVLGPPPPDYPNDSDFDVTRKSSVFNVESNVSGNVVQDIDIGFWRCITLGGTVWDDKNENGIIDNMEGGVVNVIVEVISSSGTIYQDISNFDGEWEIYPNNNCLPTDTYEVRIAQSNFDLPTGALVNWHSSPGSAPLGPPWIDNDDNGMGSASSQTSAGTFYFVSNEQPVGEPDDPDNSCDNYNNLTIDFGFYHDCGSGSNPFTIYANCDDAFDNPVCDVGVLDNFCSAMFTTNNGTGPTPLCPSACSVAGGITGVPHNTSWISFIASSSCIDMTIYPTNCQNGTGLQWGIYEAIESPCNDGNCITCDANCNGLGIIDIQSCDFIPGQQYFLWLDGCNGTYCNYEIQVLNGSGTFTLPPINIDECITGCIPPNPPPSGTAYHVCEGASSVVFAVDTNHPNYPDFYDSYIDDYEWTIVPGLPSGPIPNTNSNSVTLDLSSFSVGQTLNLCMTNVGNVCSTAGPHCFDILISDYLPIADFEFSTSLGEVTFTNTSLYGDSYYWDFGDGNNSTDENPIHVYTSSGTYSVSLIVTNICGSSEIIKNVNVNLIPVAAFTTVQNATGCEPYTIDFVDESLGNPVSWLWMFEGGNPSSSTSQYPTVVYNQEGTYDVSLMVANASGSDMITELDYVVIDPIPEASFTYNIVGNLVTFANTSLYGSSFYWDFGDGSSSTVEHPIHTYANGGAFTIVLTVTNNCGMDFFQEVIQISVEPIADFTTVQSPDGCEPLMVNFVDASQNSPTSWTWLFPGGDPSSSILQNPTVIYDAGGSFDVTLEVSNGAGNDIVVKTNFVNIDPLPEADFSFVANGADVNFSNNSLDATTFTWDFGDGNMSSEENPSHTYGNFGDYNVELIVNNSCGSDTIVKVISVTLTPIANFSTIQSPSGCVQYQLEFEDMSSNSPDYWNWTFEGGEPGTSNDQNPVIIYNQTGDFDVTLEVGNAQGTDEIVKTDFVVISDKPDVSFTEFQNVLEVSFDGMVDNASSLLWNFGDGEVSILEDPMHTYMSEGDYQVELMATNSCGDSTFTKTIAVYNLPTAGFTVVDTIGCAPLSVHFQDASSNNVTSWNWTFPGGDPSTSTEQNPIVDYVNPGIYDVMLEVSSPNGMDVITILDQIIVLDIPMAMHDAIISDNEVLLINQTLSDSVSWNISDGSIYEGDSITHVFSENDTFEIEQIVSNICGIDTSIFSVVIEAYPVANFSSIEQEVCIGDQVSFFHQGPNPMSYQWTFEGGDPSSSTLADPLITYDMAGMYDVTLVVTNQFGMDSATIEEYIHVVEEAQADFDFEVNGLEVTFTSNMSDVTWFGWNFDDGNSSMESNPTHTYNTQGIYNVSLVYSNACGSDTITSEVIVLSGPPLIDASFSEEIGCVPLVVNVTDQSLGNPTSWLWAFPGGLPESSTEQNPTVIYNDPGVYSIAAVITNSNGSSDSTFTDVIEVLGDPIAAFSAVPQMGTVSFENQSQGGSTYLWEFGDGNSSIEENPIHTYGQSGAYTVTLTVTNACGTSSEVITIQVDISSLNEVEEASFDIVPNPNNGNFIVRFAQPLSNGSQIQIIDILGRSVYELMDVQAGKEQVEIKGLNSKGTHILQIITGERRISKKLIVI